jgi:hypothetical protein
MPRVPDIYIAGPRNPDGSYDKSRSVVLLGPPDVVASIWTAIDAIKEERRQILLPPPEAQPGTHALVGHRLKVMDYFLGREIDRMVWSENPIEYNRRRAQRVHIALQRQMLHESARLFGERSGALDMAEVVEARCITGKHERLTAVRELPSYPSVHVHAMERELRAAEELHGRLINEAGNAPPQVLPHPLLQQ